MVPDPFSLPTGCKFNPRCSRVYGLCRQEDPPLIEAEPGHWVRCHLYA
ncbi:MAG: hypothetical protein MUQ10_10395 [Anaerolineae bacterium]|nr:hypothetical protein [Anaerolineae bacterium]